MKKVAFICVHNSCRSQIAEAFGKAFGENYFNSYSAGTVKVESINKDAVRIMKTNYNIDMSMQQSKLIEDLPNIDIVILIGCNVKCPNVNASHIEDWGLDDPSNKLDDVFIYTIEQIKSKILNLIEYVKVNY